MKKIKLLTFSLAIAFASCSDNKQTAETEKSRAPKIVIDKYIFSKDSKNVATVLFIDGKLTFINGKDTSVLRQGYIQSTNGLNKDYSCDFSWRNDTCYVLSMDVDLVKIGNPKNIAIKKTSDSE